MDSKALAVGIILGLVIGALGIYAFQLSIQASQIQQLMEENAALQQQINSLQAQLESKNAEIAALQAQLAQCQAQQPGGQQSSQPSSIVIDAASLNSATGSLTVNVRNVGQVPATIVGVYVLSASDLSLVDVPSVVQTVLLPGQSKVVGATGCTNVHAGTWYVVKVVTSDGTSATLKVKAS